MKDPSQQPFWMDDPNPYSARSSATTRTPASSALRQILDKVSRFFNVIIMLAFVVALAVVIISYPDFAPLGLIMIGLILFSLAVSVFQTRRMGVSATNAVEIQDQAQQQTGASHIGSAVHVAGHPLLERDQEVVLALQDDLLYLYAYASSQSIDAFPVSDIQTIHTVVYDEDRIPHVEVIDITAQALQFEIHWRGQTCTCLFRRMRKVRPIDWYHALQQARLIDGG